MLKIYNSLTRKKEEFKPLRPPTVGLYTCGPTVYDYVSIGNLRTFTLSDVVRRVLKINGYKVKAVMNITDVGHLTGDNQGNADIGEDRLEKAAARENKTAWDIAEFYTAVFLSDIRKLNILLPDVMPRATDHIEEQIKLVQQLEGKGLVYITSDGVYFDIGKYEEMGAKYGRLSTMEQIKTGARVEGNPEKKDPRDFALWKFSEKPGERHMEWQSPWGLGFPGWHIECSAMSMKYLGESFDVHVGGEDLRQIHHPNEIAQSEAATGKTFVKTWVHGTHLLVDGRRMGKSLGNVYRIVDLEGKGYDPLAVRYLYLNAHYQDPLNFTFGSLDAAQAALKRLRSQFAELADEGEGSSEYREQFLAAVNDNLNMPQALAIVWESLKSNLPGKEKKSLLLYFDEVLGLGVETAAETKIPREAGILVTERKEARKVGDFTKADRLRDELEKMGYEIEDRTTGTKVKKLKG